MSCFIWPLNTGLTVHVLFNIDEYSANRLRKVQKILDETWSIFTLGEAILMSTNNIGFYEEITKMSRVLRKPLFAYVKTKTQISCAVTAQLISAFVFATWIVQSLFYLNRKFQASSHLLWLYSQVCVGPGRKPRKYRFSHNEAHIIS